MMKNNVSKFIRRVKDTQPVEISCSECLDLVSIYVDLEISGENAANRLPQVHQHLHQCQICAEEHQILHNLAEMEARGSMPTDQELANRIKK